MTPDERRSQAVAGDKIAPPGARDACIEACLKSLRACEECSAACLATADMMEIMNECARRTRDCADVCALSARALARDSDLIVAVCALCAAACERCAEECQRHEHQPCRACAAACLRSAEACRRMVAEPAAAAR